MEEFRQKKLDDGYLWHLRKNNDDINISGCQGLGVVEGRDCKEAFGEIFWGDRIILYHDCGGGYMGIYICQNSDLYLK